MSKAQDPFYIVKEEIQESIDKLQSSFHQWERIPPDTGEQVHLTKELLANCGSIEWQVDELDKAISVAARDPSWYGIDEAELEKRRRWTSTARTQVGNVKKAVVAGKENGNTASAMRRELMRMPNSHQPDGSNQYNAEDNDDFIASESDRQMLLIKQQDEELDELSASVERIGGVGLTIHEELLAQDKIIDELGTEMDSTTNRLDFVQLGTLALKTLSKPVANRLKRQAAVAPKFRELIVSFAQANHRITTRMQRRIYSHATDVEIRPLDEEKAVQAAVDLIGELFVFTVAGVAVILEVQRSSRSEAKKEEARRQELEAIKQRNENLATEVELLRHKLEELEQLAKRQGLSGLFKFKPANTEAGNLAKPA
ncbi:hypothetical protein REPUB_Repub14bG0120300 [Reevesia pubescens]